MVDFPRWGPDFEYLQRLAKQMEDLVAPARDIARQVEAMRQNLPPLSLPEPAVLAGIRDLQESLASGPVSGALSSSFANLVDQFAALRPIIPDSRYVGEVAARTTETLKGFQLPPIPFIESLQRELALASVNAEAFRDFRQTFGGQLLDAVVAVDEAPEREKEERVGVVVDLLKSLGAKAKEFLRQQGVGIALTLYTYFQGKSDNRETADQFMAALRAVEAKVDTRDSERVERHADSRVVVAKVLKVRETGSQTARVLGRLTENYFVRVLDEQSEWAKVEYFDFLSGEVKEGWVAIRFLRTLPEGLTHD